MLVRDLNGDGTFDPVTETVGSTTTDSNGNYLFPNLPVEDNSGNPVTYRVYPDETSPSSPLSNMIPTAVVSDTPGADENTTNTGYIEVTLDTTTPTNYEADFGYEVDASIPVTGSIGFHVWCECDHDADGIYGNSVHEMPVESIAISLYTDMNGDGVIDTTKGGPDEFIDPLTDTSGQYGFSNLPVTDTSGNPITYTVVVTDDLGYAEQTGPDAQTQSGYTVTLDPVNNVNMQANFAQVHGSIGDTVWHDVNANGVQDLPAYPDPTTVTRYTVTLGLDDYISDDEDFGFYTKPPTGVTNNGSGGVGTTVGITTFNATGTTDGTTSTTTSSTSTTTGTTDGTTTGEPELPPNVDPELPLIRIPPRPRPE